MHRYCVTSPIKVRDSHRAASPRKKTKSLISSSFEEDVSTQESDLCSRHQSPLDSPAKYELLSPDKIENADATHTHPVRDKIGVGEGTHRFEHRHRNHLERSNKSSLMQSESYWRISHSVYTEGGIFAEKF